ncbi:MAG: hypothetical protein EBQ98_03145 [Actinobacteria bacterium]|nr:hypothetical protein [Actinomycetota bacterium]
MSQAIVSLIPLITFALFGITAVLVDIREHRLPNILTIRLTVVLLGVLAITSLRSGAWSGWLPMVTCTSYICGTFLLLFAVSKNGLGFGDVKFALPCGLMVGWYAPSQWLWCLWISFGLAAMTAVAMWVMGKASRTSAIAFGPFMYFSAILVAMKAVMSG